MKRNQEDQAERRLRKVNDIKTMFWKRLAEVSEVRIQKKTNNYGNAKNKEKSLILGDFSVFPCVSQKKVVPLHSKKHIKPTVNRRSTDSQY